MNQKAHIEYPTNWTYKIIARNKEDIESATHKVLRDKKFTLQPSQKSSKGSFLSMDLSLTVQSEEERTNIFHQIYGEEGIKMVL